LRRRNRDGRADVGAPVPRERDIVHEEHRAGAGTAAAVDTVLVLSASIASEELIRDAVLGPSALVAQAFGILTFFMFLRLPWVRWLARLAARVGHEGP
jgi:hypothetical protein